LVKVGRSFLVAKTGHGGVRVNIPLDKVTGYTWNTMLTPPFHCMCCGAETCYKQWAYGRSCGTCDTGACQARRLHSRLHEGKVYYGNAVLINEEEASRFGLTPDRMARVGEVAPEEWVHDTWPFLQEKAAEERDES